MSNLFIGIDVLSHPMACTPVFRESGTSPEPEFVESSSVLTDTSVHQVDTGLSPVNADMCSRKSGKEQAVLASSTDRANISSPI